MDIKVFYDQKRIKALRRSRLFNFVPFVEKVYLAGSLAIGNVHENSDFDVIVVTRPGRLYTARFFCLLFFGLMGWRRTLKNPKNGFCFNHFQISPIDSTGPAEVFGEVGAKNYAERLYQNLIEVSIRLTSRTGPVGPIGKATERLLKNWQICRIEKFLKRAPCFQNPRIIYNDERVELCLNLKEI